jgi:hypothetical protein
MFHPVFVDVGRIIYQSYLHWCRKIHMIFDADCSCNRCETQALPHYKRPQSIIQQYYHCSTITWQAADIHLAPTIDTNKLSAYYHVIVIIILELCHPSSHRSRTTPLVPDPNCSTGIPTTHVSYTAALVTSPHHNIFFVALREISTPDCTTDPHWDSLSLIFSSLDFICSGTYFGIALRETQVTCGDTVSVLGFLNPLDFIISELTKPQALVFWLAILILP